MIKSTPQMIMEICTDAELEFYAHGESELSKYQLLHHLKRIENLALQMMEEPSKP